MITKTPILQTKHNIINIRHKAYKIAKYCTLYLFFTGIFFSAMSQSAKIMPVIIDTDARADDYRALCMFFAIKEIDILAITTANETPDASHTLHKVDTLLLDFGKEGNKKLKNKQKATTIIKEKLQEAGEQVTIVCLGSLINIAKVLQQHPALKSKIKQIIWCCDFEDDNSIHFFDKNIENNILTGKCAVNIIGDSMNEWQFDDSLLQEVGQIPSPYAKRVSKFMLQEAFQNNEKQTKIGDELGVIFFLYPELFDMQPDDDNPYISKSVGFKKGEIRENLIKILAQKYTIEKNIAFEKFPVEPALYRYDVRSIAETTIQKYGIEEWKVCVLTNEIHQHLGIYSLVGAKMGVKARELLHAELDRIKVYASAGKKPPMSCLLDGLQISTGATLGLGMITLTNDTVRLPKAVFEYRGAKVALTLKPEYKQQVATDISRSIVQCGNLTDGYWKLIRRLSIKYWAEWDRNEIFIVNWIKKPRSAN